MMENPELQMKVQDWLRQEGYPLEMRTARVFRQRRWFLHHARRYKDQTLGREREIDLLAFYDDKEKDPLSRIHGHLVVECKWTADKPWILFTSEQQALTPIGHFHSTPMTDTAARAVEQLESQDVSTFPLFDGLEEGYAIVQAFSNGEAEDEAFAAAGAVIRAADFFARDMSASTTHPIVYVPIIVLDGELFRCSLTESGDVSVTPSDFGCLVQHAAENPKIGTTCVHVIRESVLGMFIDRTETTFNSLRAVLRNRRNQAKG